MLTKWGLKPRASRTESDFLPVGTALMVRCTRPSGQGLEAGAEGGSAPSLRRARRCGEEEAHGVGGRGEEGGRSGRVEARDRGVKREQRERARRQRSGGVAWHGGVARSAVRDAARARRAPGFRSVPASVGRCTGPLLPRGRGRGARRPAGPGAPRVESGPRGSLGSECAPLFRGRPGRAGAIHITATGGISNMQGQDKHLFFIRRWNTLWLYPQVPGAHSMLGRALGWESEELCSSLGSTAYCKTGRHYCTNRQLIYPQVLSWKKEDGKGRIQGKSITLACKWKDFCVFAKKLLSFT
ncbi:collagen alpha-1(I) chain-like isoform X1 [Ailuropoda melanoleuca]|uniref:collagen alpha-1(I) chain-like isoform X1 n=1 Tax=Ailuropoda melanoleuca TaxID=9646 RepID=UPI001493E60E|nr:collagen alpha-1(I) chain-like isoform X1 [Ailuropoda melanoleuca]